MPRISHDALEIQRIQNMREAFNLSRKKKGRKFRREDIRRSDVCASSRAMTEDYANCPDSFSSARHSSLAETNCGAHLSVTRSKIVVSPFGLSAGSLHQGPVHTRRETSYARETPNEDKVNYPHTHTWLANYEFVFTVSVKFMLTSAHVSVMTWKA